MEGGSRERLLARLVAGGISLAESGRLPDPLIRSAMRRVIAARATALDRRDERADQAVIESLSSGPLTEAPDLANRQHYEVPVDFFRLMLGPRLKYSCSLWEDGTTTLADAEEGMLSLTASRARLADGQRILELGAGWGSLTVWMAERFPGSEITAVTNSTGQAAFIAQQAGERGINRMRVQVADVARYHPDGRFDRIVSVEMLEHVRNYRELFRRISDWLEQDGLFFAHVFGHVSAAYLYRDRGPADWMARTFFSGGVMPAHSLFARYGEDLRVEKSWRLSGIHYRRTLDSWLDRLDRNLEPAGRALRSAGDSVPTVQQWRMFLMACSELFGYRGGNLWGVSHYVLRPH